MIKHELEGMNEFISGLDNDGEPKYNVKEYTEGSGKVVPYMGWFWRRVPFREKRLTLGAVPDSYIGFMENNKWDYDEWETTEKQRDEIVRLLLVARSAPSNEAFQAVFDYIQTCKPGWDLKSQEQHRAEERVWYEKSEMGPPVYFKDGTTSGDKETDDPCPKCKTRNLWSCGPNLVVCFCGYQDPDEATINNLLEGE